VAQDTGVELSTHDESARHLAEPIALLASKRGQGVDLKLMPDTEQVAPSVAGGIVPIGMAVARAGRDE
jgi:hypothetical protein